MTTPPAPAPPAPTGPPAPPDSAEPPAPGDDLAELRRAVESLRGEVKDKDAELAKLRAAQMSGTEKAIAAARAEGKAEAESAAALVLVAAEFRAAAAGKLADPDAAIAVLDLSKLTKDGQPDKAAIAELVGKLATVPPAPGTIPAGPRSTPSLDGGDWIRQATRGR
jgi:hypothetical protein